MSSGVFSLSHSGLFSRKLSQYYLAYGLNLSTEQMKQRCPDAEVMGTASIPGYRLLFKKSGSGFYATIEQDANCSVPVLVYKISKRDEALLNGYEGFPKHYYKKYFRLPIYKPDGKRMSEKHTCMVYILHEERLLGEPRTDYFRRLDGGYERWGFDTAILDKGLSDSIGVERARKYIDNYIKALETSNKHTT